MMDDLPLWIIELIWDYGFDRAVLFARQHGTPRRTRKALEADRLEREALRWANGGRLPV